jgi:hypothetical protein
LIFLLFLTKNEISGIQNPFRGNELRLSEDEGDEGDEIGHGFRFDKRETHKEGNPEPYHFHSFISFEVRKFLGKIL